MFLYDLACGNKKIYCFILEYQSFSQLVKLYDRKLDKLDKLDKLVMIYL